MIIQATHLRWNTEEVNVGGKERGLRLDCLYSVFTIVISFGRI